MTEAHENEASDDRGALFFEVRLYAPSSASIESLGPALRDGALRSIQKARRKFRSKTLPSLSSPDVRLYRGDLSSLFALSHEVDAALLEGIEDEEALAKLAPPPPGKVFAGRIDLVRKGMGEERSFETRFAADLLGKYWYRHRERDIFDAIEHLNDMKAAQERGTPIRAVPPKKPPAPPRR